MIKFYRGLRSKYTYQLDSPGLFLDVLFFATDTGELLLNGQLYGSDGEKLKDVLFDPETNIFTFVKQNGENVTVDLNDKVLTDEDRRLLDTVSDLVQEGLINVTYNSQLDSDVATVEKFGGISAGTKVSDLNGRPISEILDEMIFPTIQPTITAPSASISLKSGESNIKEVGSAGYTKESFNTSFNLGTIKIGNTLLANRAGNKTGDTIYAGSESNGIPSTISAGTTNFYYKVSYDAGPTPLDSKGKPATSYSALPAGSVTSGALATYGVYPFFANVSNAEVTKLPLTNSTTFVLKLAAEGPNKHVFKLPHTITKIEMLNTLSNLYEEYGLENFTVTLELIEVQASLVLYSVYTRNDAGFNGETTYRITYSK